MDTKQAIEELNNLIPNNPDYNDKIIALTKAIKSLEAWDKINEELEKEMNEYENVLSDLSYSDGLGYALAVIDEHLGGES